MYFAQEEKGLAMSEKAIVLMTVVAVFVLFSNVMLTAKQEGRG